MNPLEILGIIGPLGCLVMASVYIQLRKKFEPFLEYPIAVLKKEPVAITLQGDGRITMHRISYIEGVIRSTGLHSEAAWLHRAKTYRFGETQAILLADDWGITYDPEVAAAIEQVTRNKTFQSWKDLQDALKERLDPVKVPPLREVAPSKIRKYIAPASGPELYRQITYHVNRIIKLQQGPGAGGMDMKTLFLYAILFVIILGALKAFNIF